MRRHSKWMGSVVMRICFMQMFSKNKWMSKIYCLSFLCHSFLNLQMLYQQGRESWQYVTVPQSLYLIAPATYTPGKVSHTRRYRHLGDVLCLLWTFAFTSPPFSLVLSLSLPGEEFEVVIYIGSGEICKALVSARSLGLGEIACFWEGSLVQRQGNSAGWLWSALSSYLTVLIALRSELTALKFYCKGLEIAPVVKCLLYMPEDPSSGPLHSHKKPGTASQDCYFSLEFICLLLVLQALLCKSLDIYWDCLLADVLILNS